MDSETWVIEEGGRVIQNKASLGLDELTDWERLVYALWVADYGMRNAGDLDAATDVCADWQSVGLKAAEALSLPVAREVFGLAPGVLQERFLELFEAICGEVRSAEPFYGL